MIRCGIIIDEVMRISLLNADVKYEASTLSPENNKFYPYIDGSYFKNIFGGSSAMPDRLHKTISWKES